MSEGKLLDQRSDDVVDRWAAGPVRVHLFSANRLPYAARGFFTHRRVGADVLVPDAFRLLTTP